MKPDEARKQINMLKPFLACEDSDLSKRIIDSLNTANEALKKQIAKAPVEWKCPTCDKPIYHEQQLMHCKHCGQLVDWRMFKCD